MAAWILIGLLILVAAAVPVAAVLGILSFILDEIAMDGRLTLGIGEIIWDKSKEFILVAVPMFILLGEIMLRAGIATRMYGAVIQWLSWLPGGLMHANIGSCTIFAASSGSSVATAATVGTVAYPEIEKRRYNERLFLGSLAAGGTLGILVPPSINLIIYGLLTDTSVPELYLAGIIPGVVLATLFMAMIAFACLYRREWGGDPVRTSWGERFRTLPDLLPPIMLFAVVVGSIYAGVATPTEAAAVGVVFAIGLAAWQKYQAPIEGPIDLLPIGVGFGLGVGAIFFGVSVAQVGLIMLAFLTVFTGLRKARSFKFWLFLSVMIFPVVAMLMYAPLPDVTRIVIGVLAVIAAIVFGIFRGALTTSIFIESFEGTMRTTAMIMLIVFAAIFLNFVLGFMGITQAMLNFIAELGISPVQTVLLIVVFYLLLGMFMETLSMMLTTVPVVFPIVMSLNVPEFTDVWFGIMITILMEAALITPPIGVNLYVVHGIRDRGGKFGDVAIGSVPFVFAMLAMIGILIVFPEAATWLPTLVYH